eukprot:1376374-Heterocapsa_arctica.AAC.1
MAWRLPVRASGGGSSGSGGQEGALAVAVAVPGGKHRDQELKQGGIPKKARKAGSNLPGRSGAKKDDKNMIKELMVL